MGQQIFNSNGSFTVPIGVTEVTVKAIGGGGSGAICNYGATPKFLGGGYAGQVTEATVTVTPEQVIPVTIGNGGAGVTSLPQPRDGNNGGSSSFGTLVTVSGGAGGKQSLAQFNGNGQPVTNVFGTFTCGSFYQDPFHTNYGGQAGAGNGGNARIGSTPATGGGIGSGGGGSTTPSQGSAFSGAGGKGQIIVSWDDAPTDKPEFRINGTVIPDGLALNAGSVIVNGIPCKTITENGSIVWEGFAFSYALVDGESVTEDALGQISVVFVQNGGVLSIRHRNNSSPVTGSIQFDTATAQFSGGVTVNGKENLSYYGVAFSESIQCIQHDGSNSIRYVGINVLGEYYANTAWVTYDPATDTWSGGDTDTGQDGALLLQNGTGYAFSYKPSGRPRSTGDYLTITRTEV